MYRLLFLYLGLCFITTGANAECTAVSFHCEGDQCLYIVGFGCQRSTQSITVWPAKEIVLQGGGTDWQWNSKDQLKYRFSDECTWKGNDVFFCHSNGHTLLAGRTYRRQAYGTLKCRDPNTDKAYQAPNSRFVCSRGCTPSSHHRVILNANGNCNGPALRHSPTYSSDIDAYVTFSSSDLRVSFDHPSNWKVTACPKHKANSKCLAINTGRKRSAEPQIQIAITRESLKSLTKANGRFMEVDGKLMSSGRNSMSNAISIKNANHRGIYGTGDCSISPSESDDGNFHAAGGDCLTAILSNGSRSAVIETSGLVNSEIVIKKIIGSFEFHDVP